MPKFGCVNIHASLLPAYRGAAPIQWAVINGERESGVTIMQMDEGLDTGAMLAKCETAIGERETAGELFGRLAQDAAALLGDTVRRMAEGPLSGEPQDDSKSCYAHMLDKEIAVIDWTKSAREVDCLIRGLNPWPCAWTTVGGKRLKVLRSVVAERLGRQGKPGEVLSHPGEEFVVACGQGSLVLLEVQLEGKKAMPGAVYLGGTHGLTGQQLGR